MGSQAIQGLSAAEALQSWLNATNVTEERAKILMQYGKELISEIQQS